MRHGNGRIDLAALRERLSGLEGPRFWRSLEELAGDEAFTELLRREFPEGATDWDDRVSRRRFIQLMGASLALGGLASCTPPPRETIVPYVRQPEDLVPGKPMYFATAVTLAGYAAGVLVESHMGRPTKIEGNPDHPASLGATDARTQASILTLYDPDRSSTIKHLGSIRPWGDFLTALRSAVAAQRSRGGAGLRILTGAVTSPTLSAQIREILARLPEARWHVWEPAGADTARDGAVRAFGRNVEMTYRFDRADIIVSLDADFLSSGPGQVRYIRDFASRRKVPAVAGHAAPAGHDPSAGHGAAGGGHHNGDAGPGMSRLYVIETAPSLTGAMADHRWPVRSSEIARVARVLATALSIDRGGELEEPPPGIADADVYAIACDLTQHMGRSIILAGPSQPPFVHAAAHAMNETLGNIGRTVIPIAPVETRPPGTGHSLRDLAAAMDAGSVDALLVLDSNPVHTAPGDLDFAAMMDRVPLRVHLGLYEDETALRCHWHVPQAHELESWSDARSFDGTATILQPLIEPLYGGRTAHEVLAAMSDRPSRSSEEIVREHWKGRMGAGGFEAAWKRALHDGHVAGSAFPAETVSLRPGWHEETDGEDPPANIGGDRPEVVFLADPAIHDGRDANNGWLQEMPRPLTKLTWDNPALIAPAMAARLGLSSGDEVELSVGDRSVTAPVWVMPGHADGSVTVHLGYGRSAAGRVGNGVGFDASVIRPSASPRIARGLLIRPTGRRTLLAGTQEHHVMEGRALVRSADLDHYREHPDFAQHAVHEPDDKMTMYPPFQYDGYSWGMAIDLNACVGCNACVIACQAENNVPVVGREQVATGREMHWLRIDRYYEGDLDNPRTHHQPVLCMHCENAPCELVCPVAATVHSSEGLNDMVYNRCVGTRYCSNNCPYKVRRFNFLEYADFDTPSLRLLHNPDVTVRTRGVMEKCTYCVQRINQARNEAGTEGRSIRDGDIVTACQQACPAEAISFGDINDPASRVSTQKADARNYNLLGELNTRPRTTYLASIRNPNPEITGRTGES